MKNKKAQATMEFFAFILLAFTIIWFGTKEIFLPMYRSKTESINRYNKILKVTDNMRKYAVIDSEPVSVEITKFNIPTLGFDPGAIANTLINTLMDEFGDDLFKKLKLDSTESWYKSGIRGGTEAFVRSGFDYKQVPWGFGLGVVTSGDAKTFFAGGSVVSDFGPVQPSGFFAGDYMSIAGQGVQGALTGYFSSQGDWDQALEGGLSGALGSSSFQTKLSNALGNRNFLVSTATGALSGAITGGNEGMLQGAMLGSLRSNFVQNNVVAKALGGKDYLVNAANVSAVTAIQGGDANSILSGAALAAFSTSSVQKAVFGDNPNSLVQNVGNATVSGGVAAVATKDINQLYYAAGGAVANALVKETIETAYGAVKGEESLKKHMDDVKFASSLATTGAVILADPQTAMGYGQYVTAQAVKESLLEKYGNKENDGEKDVEAEVESPKDDEEKNDKQEETSMHMQRYDHLSLSNKIESLTEEDLKHPFENGETNIAQNSKNNKFPDILLASTSLPKIELAAYKVKRSLPRESRSAKMGSSMKKSAPIPRSKVKKEPSKEKEIDPYQAIETMTPEEVLNSKAYKNLIKNKDTAKELLRKELKATIRNINALYLLRQGYLKEDAEALLSSRNFERALEKATKDKAITKQLSSIVDYALSPQNISQTLLNIQQRIVAERAYFVELKLRKMLWDTERQDLIYSKSKRKNIFVEIYRKIGG